MKLAEWLSRNGMSRVEFARRIGVTPGAVTQLCNSAQAWLSRDTAELIARETRGAVTPNDFLPASAKEALMPHSVTEAIEAFARGEIVIVTDDDDRENEGDLIVAASLCTPEKMAFIIRNTCGIVCAPLTAAEARRLRLDPMVASNDAPLGTAFTVTVDVKHGLTTGISAEQRSNTVRALANHNMGAADFVRPGHVFPLIAKDGGVLMRSGHTEAAVDLCRLAGLPPVGVICELANDDGTVMKGEQIDAFAEKHGLQAHLGRRSHRLSPGAREARRAHRDLPGRDRSGGRSRAMPIRRPSTACSTWRSSTAASATARTSPCACTAPMRSPTCSRAARR